jgi:hypothetical protein
MTEFRDLADSVCADMYWPTYRQLPVAERMDWVIARTLEVDHRVYEEKYGPVAVPADSAQHV